MRVKSTSWFLLWTRIWLLTLFSRLKGKSLRRGSRLTGKKRSMKGDRQWCLQWWTGGKGTFPMIVTRVDQWCFSHPLSPTSVWLLDRGVFSSSVVGIKMKEDLFLLVVKEEESDCKSTFPRVHVRYWPPSPRITLTLEVSLIMQTSLDILTSHYSQNRTHDWPSFCRWTMFTSSDDVDVDNGLTKPTISVESRRR